MDCAVELSGSGGAPVTHPKGFCQGQAGGVMHSYWCLAVAILTIGELGELGELGEVVGP